MPFSKNSPPLGIRGDSPQMAQQNRETEGSLVPRNHENEMEASRIKALEVV